MTSENIEAADSFFEDEKMSDSSKLLIIGHRLADIVSEFESTLEAMRIDRSRFSAALLRLERCSGAVCEIAQEI